VSGEYRGRREQPVAEQWRPGGDQFVLQSREQLLQLAGPAGQQPVHVTRLRDTSARPYRRGEFVGLQGQDSLEVIREDPRGRQAPDPPADDHCLPGELHGLMLRHIRLSN
jgi:hypothetical protein